MACKVEEEELEAVTEGVVLDIFNRGLRSACTMLVR